MEVSVDILMHFCYTCEGSEREITVPGIAREGIFQRRRSRKTYGSNRAEQNKELLYCRPH